MIPAGAELLAVHTSDEPGSVAVVHAGRVEAREFASQGQYATTLLAAIRSILEAAGAGLEDLHGLVASTGPGSFTGIRIGLATAQGLAAARGWQVLSCDSLVALAAACPRPGSPLAVVRDARRGEVYAALYEMGAGLPRVLVEPFCAAPVAAATRLAGSLGTGRATESGPRAGEPPRLGLVGSGAELVLPALAERAAGIELVAPGGVDCIARALLELAGAGGCRQCAPEDLEPTYLRKSDAELQRQRSRTEARGAV